MEVWSIIQRETGGLLHLEEHCTKSGEKVMEVLHTKHPDAHTPSSVGGRASQDARGGDSSDLRAVPHRRPQKGV